jgi:sulfate-transporting ATPase
MKVVGLLPRPRRSVRDRIAAGRIAREIASAEQPHEHQRVPARPLVLDGVGVRFGGIPAVDGLSMTVEPGQVHGLIGPNGAGKTTAIDAITGFVRMSGGRIRLDGQDVAGWSARRRARAGIARSFQSLELFSDLTVRENIAVAHDDSSRWRRLLDVVWPTPARLSPLATAAAQFCELTPHLDERADTLPFGKRKLVAIARAIATGPSVLLLDEPAAGLDDHEAAEFSNLVRTLAREWRIAILLVEHNVQVIMGLCDQITVLDGGKLLATGTPEAIQANPAVLDAYLGSDSADTSGSAPRPAYSSISASLKP